MIPKIIHYCWFGRGEMPELIHKCIDSWKRILPDYELHLWNEDNFDVTINQYTAEAYAERKFAFVTDYCRLYAMKEVGGVYLDTDVEILKSLDELLLNNVAFSGFEDNNFLPTGIMASVKDGKWVTDLLAYYDKRSFYLENGTIDYRTNTDSITAFMKDKGVIMNNTYQKIEDYCTLYPSEYFCPKSWETAEIKLTAKTYCIHHFAGSWLPSRKKQKLYDFLVSIFGLKALEAVSRFIREKLK